MLLVMLVAPLYLTPVWLYGMFNTFVLIRAHAVDVAGFPGLSMNVPLVSFGHSKYPLRSVGDGFVVFFKNFWRWERSALLLNGYLSGDLSD